MTNLGYRSIGKVWFPDKTLKELPKELVEDLKEWTVELDNVWSFDSWKWYDSYESVARWEAFFSHCRDNELQFDWMRIGEDIDDVHMEHGGVFYYSREIDISYYLDLKTGEE